MLLMLLITVSIHTECISLNCTETFPDLQHVYIPIMKHNSDVLSYCICLGVYCLMIYTIVIHLLQPMEMLPHHLASNVAHKGAFYD